MFAQVFPHPTDDLICVERRIQGQIAFLEDVERVWRVDDRRVVAYISGQKQGRYVHSEEAAELAGKLFNAGYYAHFSIWDLSPDRPTLLARSALLSESDSDTKPIFYMKGNRAISVSSHAGADHYRTSVIRFDLACDRMTQVYEKSARLSGVKEKGNAIIVFITNQRFNRHAGTTSSLTFRL